MDFDFLVGVGFLLAFDFLGGILLDMTERDSAFLLTAGFQWALFNIARWDLTQKAIDYGWLEKCKDGHFVSGKYVPVSRMIDHPTLVVFANAPLPAGPWLWH